MLSPPIGERDVLSNFLTDTLKCLVLEIPLSRYTDFFFSIGKLFCWFFFFFCHSPNFVIVSCNTELLKTRLFYTAFVAHVQLQS